MCEHASVHDAEIKRLCQNIISSQQAVIDQMRAILRSSRDEAIQHHCYFATTAASAVLLSPFGIA